MPTSLMPRFQRALAGLIAATVLLTSPGPLAYRAAAQEVAPQTGVQTVEGLALPVTLNALPVGGTVGDGSSIDGATLGASFRLETGPQLTQNVVIGARAANTVRTGLSHMPSAGVEGMAKTSARRQGAAQIGAKASPTGSAGSKEDSAVRTSEKVGRIAVGVESTLGAAGKLSEAPVQSAYAVGREMQDSLTGEGRAAAAAESDGSVVKTFGAFAHPSGSGWGVSLAKPAGDDISRAVQAAGDGPSNPIPPRADGSGGNNGGGNDKGPLLPRLLASGISLLPALLIGLPLLHAGLLAAGGLVALTSLGLAAFPFMSQSTSKLARSWPGAMLLALGGVAAFSGVPVLGAMVALGGWGFIRFGRMDRSSRYWDRFETLGGFFGALGAAAGAGLVLLGPAGWLATGLSWLAYPAAALLWMHLPKFMGTGVEAAFRNLYESVRGVYHVQSSLRRDTVLLDRLMRFSSNQVKRFGWFSLLWVGGLWVPVIVSETAQFLASLAVGLAIGIVQAPMMFGWGAFHEVREKHWILMRYTVLFGAWAHGTFDAVQGSKVWLFNPIEKKLLPAANSRNLFARTFGALGIRALQWLWLAFTAAEAVPFMGVLFFHTFWSAPETYDAKRHDPDHLDLQADPLPNEKPDIGSEDPGRPDKEPLFPKLLASGIALLPLWFLGLPMFALGAPLAAWLYMAATGAMALLPLMPSATPKFLRQVPGFLMIAVGALSLITGAGTFMGIAGVLSGWGLANFVTKEKDADKLYSVNDPAYVGAFFGALAMTTGLGLVLGGAAGTIAAVLRISAYPASALLIYHLPQFVWRGTRSALGGFGYSMSKLHQVMNFWEADTEFYRNLSGFFDYWQKKSGLNWTWLWLPWVPLAAIELAEYLVSFALGLALGALRAPALFAWGAAYQISPRAKTTRFIAGFARSWLENSEGAKPLFDRWVARLKSAMNAKTAGSGRPTAGAALALLGARFVQAAWLLRLALWSPIILIRALVDGVKNASGEYRPPKDQWSDPDNPRRTL